MIKVSVMYPNGNDVIFDMDYYCNTHGPLVSGLLGDTLIGVTVEKGLSGAAGAPAVYIAMGHMYFNSVEEFEKAFGRNAEKIISDKPNFTNSHPIVQVSEVMM